jgi:3-oxoacyl-[acyl-carrier protein] reductase
MANRSLHTEGRRYRTTACCSYEARVEKLEHKVFFVDLSGKTAIVAGGGGAIGSAIATKLACLGCEIALLDLRDVTDTAMAIIQLGRQAFECRVDLTDSWRTRDAIAESVACLGGLDILVNASGVTSHGTFETLREDEWDRVMAANLKSVFVCCQAAIGPMRKRGGGRIVNVGSVLAKNGGNAQPWLDRTEQQHSGNVAYGVSKAGVHTITSYLSRELASFGITVNAVAPGPITSAMTESFPDRLRALIPLGRMGTPNDVAGTVAFLASEYASYITGEIIDVNGGLWSD